MKRTFILINTTKGSTVNESDLTNAIKEEEIW
ncbi:MAG: hypothetical protein J6581_00695 [Apibacter sp.]|nr:hypothetical protein [Apibacter sp.]